MRVQPLHWQDRSVLACLWLPVSWLYYLIVRFRMILIRSRHLPVPVVCIGNNTVGGAGKTPTAIAVAHWLIGAGYKPHIISRGYQGHYTGTLRVNPEFHIAQEVGDEPLLLAKHAPCWVSRRRMDAASAAIKAGADVIIMDDGLQNPTLQKDCSILVVDGPYGIGNGWMLPAGPCREPFSTSLGKVDMVLMIGEPIHPAMQRKLQKNSPPVFYGALSPKSDLSLKGMRLHPFAGIGNPDKFFSTIETMGGIITLCSRFADHHYYTQADIDRLKREAAAHDAMLITTEKDATRLPEDFMKHVMILPVSLAVKQEQTMSDLILSCLQSKTKRKQAKQ